MPLPNTSPKPDPDPWRTMAPAANLSVETFLARLEDVGIPSAVDARALLSELPAGKRPLDGEEWARELVRRGKLTAYQAQAVCQGKGKGLSLGNYLVLEKLGQGGMGIVFKAEHRRMRRVVALKVLPPALTKSPEARARFRREVEAAAKLEHPNICTAYDADEAGGVQFFVMQYIDGSDLSALVRENGPMSVDLALHCVIGAARGLEYAHGRGVIHRDVKPSNLLLDHEGNVKVLDMGLARIEAAGQAELTSTGDVMGTIDFMAPEQALDTKNADARCDVYSLGLTLWYLLVGKPVYAGDSLMAKLMAHREEPVPSLRDTRPDVSAALDAVFQQMASKKPDNRIQSMSEVIQALEKCQEAVGGGSTGRKSRGASQIETLVYQHGGRESKPDRSAGKAGRRPAALNARLSWLRDPRVVAGAAGCVAFLIVGIVIFAFAGPNQSHSAVETGPSETGPTAPTANSVNEKPVADALPAPAESSDFMPLFNGKDLTGWQVINADGVNSSIQHPEWTTKDGILTCATRNHGWLRSRDQYEDFELRLEFQLPPDANTGILIRTDTSGRTMSDGLEVDLLNGRNAGKLHSGGIGGVTNPPRSYLKPAGEWNQLRIQADGMKFFVELNGHTTCDVDLTNDPRAAKVRQVGHIGLYNYKGYARGVAFRNISIKKLPSIDGASGKTAAEAAWTPLFNGVDLEGWKKASDEAPWTVEDGVLVGRKGPHPRTWIATVDSYGDFELALEYKLARGTNSGVFLRTWPQALPKNARLLEIQLVDNGAFPELRPVQFTGALYDLAPPTTKLDTRPDTWHSLYLKVVGDHLEVAHDDTPCLDVHIAPLVKNNERTRPDGPLILNAQGVTRFRDIRIRLLNPDGTPAGLKMSPTAK